MAKGGARPGAGRPTGSTNVPKFRDFVNQEERDKFVEFILDQYMGDMRLALWLGDQLFGKATQAVELGGPDGTPLVVQISEAIARKNNIDA
jgi:hypothetical protein